MANMKIVEKVRKRIDEVKALKEAEINGLNDRIDSAVKMKESAEDEMREATISNDSEGFMSAKNKKEDADFQEKTLREYLSGLSDKPLVNDDEAKKIENDLDNLSQEIKSNADKEIKQLIARLVDVCTTADKDIREIRDVMTDWMVNVAKDSKNITNNRGLSYYDPEIKGVHPEYTAYTDIVKALGDYPRGNW